MLERTMGGVKERKDNCYRYWGRPRRAAPTTRSTAVESSVPLDEMTSTPADRAHASVEGLRNLGNW